MRVLVAYGSKNGGTAGLAQMIGQELTASGFTAEVVPAAEVRGLDGYDAVVLAGALYAARWHRDARRFARRHATALRVRPLWLVSSGPIGPSADGPEPRPVRQVAALASSLGARGQVTFGGRLEAGAKGFVAGKMARKVAGDWRDPAKVHAWATGVTEELRRTHAPVPGP